jgi:3-oxoacyl-[acyl-carrier protein] reductase
LDLTNKVALITGSSRGIGRATAFHMGRRGIRIAVTYYKSSNEAAEVVSQLHDIGVESRSFQLDVADPFAVRRVVSEVQADFGSIDILVNNAGAIFRPGDWSNVDEDHINRTIDVNLKGPLHCIQAVAPLMLRQQFGRIINLTSTYAIVGASAVAIYTAAKAGVISLTKGFAKEFAPYITVNAVAPGNINTDMTRGAGGAFNEWAIATTPLKRLGEADEIAEAIMFLASADFITAHVLVIDGGQMSQIL